MSKRTNNTTVETFTVNALNQLTAVPDSTPSYDHRGNLTQRYFPAGPQYYWTYTYDAENQLASVATDTYYTYDTYRFKVEFTYDGQGRLRVRKDYTWASGIWNLASETRYVYDGMLLVQERNSSNTPTVTYTRGRDLSGSLAGAGGIGGLLARSHGYSAGNWSSHNFYHADGNGNVTALVNSAGTLQASYKYDPFGRYLGQSGALATANVLRFSSKPWVGFNGSTSAGLYSYGYRFYDPYLQRWVNRDPIGEEEGPNLYAIVSNNTLSTFDPFGLEKRPKKLPSETPSFPPDIGDVPPEKRDQNWVVSCMQFCDAFCSKAPCPQECLKGCNLDCMDTKVPNISNFWKTPSPKPGVWRSIVDFFKLLNRLRKEAEKDKNKQVQFYLP